MGLMDAKSQLIQVSMSQADQLSANMTGQRRVKAVHFMHTEVTQYLLVTINVISCKFLLELDSHLPFFLSVLMHYTVHRKKRFTSFQLQPGCH